MWPVDEADDGEDPPVPDFIATEARLGAHNYEPLGAILSRDEGVWVWDAQGKRYLDCVSAYSAVNQGHCHPKSWPLWWNRPAH
jgi:ornithine--oxo-acid transaminase